MKRRMTELCLLLCALLLMNGCGAANLFGSRGSSPRTLRFMHPDPEHQGVYEQLAQKYSKLHEGLTVKVLCAARDRYAADWLAAQKGDSPADLFAVLPGEGFAAFSESGILSKLKTDELLPEGYDKNLLQFGSDGKNTLAVPVTGSVPLIFYNAALYEKYGLIEPATISDFIVNCQLLKNQTVRHGRKRWKVGYAGFFRRGNRERPPQQQAGFRRGLNGREIGVGWGILRSVGGGVFAGHL